MEKRRKKKFKNSTLCAKTLTRKRELFIRVSRKKILFTRKGVDFATSQANTHAAEKCRFISDGDIKGSANFRGGFFGGGFRMVVINYRQASTFPAAGFVIENNIIAKIVIRVAKSPLGHILSGRGTYASSQRAQNVNRKRSGTVCTMRKSYFSSFECFSFMFESKMDSLICLMYK